MHTKVNKNPPTIASIPQALIGHQKMTIKLCMNQILLKTEWFKLGSSLVQALGCDAGIQPGRQITYHAFDPPEMWFEGRPTRTWDHIMVPTRTKHDCTYSMARYWWQHAGRRLRTRLHEQDTIDTIVLNEDVIIMHTHEHSKQMIFSDYLRRDVIALNNLSSVHVTGSCKTFCVPFQPNTNSHVDWSSPTTFNFLLIDHNLEGL